MVLVKINAELLRKLSHGCIGRGTYFDRLMNVISNGYLSIAYGVNNLLLKRISSKTSELISFQEKKKTRRTVQLKLPRMEYKGRMEKCSFQYP